MKKMKQLLAIATMCLSSLTFGQLVENSSDGRVGVGSPFGGARFSIRNINEQNRGMTNYTYSTTLTQEMMGSLNYAMQYNTSASNRVYGSYNYTLHNGSSGDVFGVYSAVRGSTSGAKYGVFSQMSGSRDNDWAGYFLGRSYFSSNVGIGTTDFTTPDGTSFKLAVNGGIVTNEFRVNGYSSNQWAEYVFADDYDLTPLKEVASFIKEHKHLPEVPSAIEVEANGVDMKEMTILHMKKIEELILYMIELQKANEALQAQVDLLK